MYLTEIVAMHLLTTNNCHKILQFIFCIILRVAFHGCLVSDCDQSDHDHRADREIVQKTDLGTYIYIYIITLIRKCVQCTLILIQRYT